MVLAINSRPISGYAGCGYPGRRSLPRFALGWYEGAPLVLNAESAVFAASAALTRDCLCIAFASFAPFVVQKIAESAPARGTVVQLVPRNLPVRVRRDSHLRANRDFIKQAHDVL